MRPRPMSFPLICAMIALTCGSTITVMADSTSCIVDTKTFMVLDSETGSYFFDNFNLMAQGTAAQIWVQVDLSWPTGDPRPTPEITCDHAAHMLSEFESTIRPGEVATFGSPDLHDGSASLLVGWGFFPLGYYEDPAGRQIVLVDNIQDKNFNDHTHLPYNRGFYSPTFEAYFDRNLVTVDAFDWENRTGPGSAFPYFYERVLAREYNHLLQDDFDPDEETFITEGLADLTGYLVGYGLPMDSISAAAAHPENSLVIWEDQGALEIESDFGHAVLFQLYLLERFGTDFITSLFLDPGHGITGVNSTLSGLGFQERFNDVYHDFRVAMMIDDDQGQDGRFGFAALDFELDLGTPESPNPEAYSTPGAPPWGTDYIWVDGDPRHLRRLIFNGADCTSFPSAWTSDGEVLWSGSGDLLDNWAIFEATGGGTLTFDTYWDIEDYWDFGFVQVSMDDGATWSSLGNSFTTSDHDPSSLPEIIDNLPGLTGWSCSVSSECWLNIDYDLGPFAGQDILIAFRYMTDWGTQYEGWLIDNIDLNGSMISDGSDASIFKDITEILPIDNDFTVTVVGIAERGPTVRYSVNTINLDEITEEGVATLRGVLSRADRAAILVTFDAPEGFTSYADYSYDFFFAGGGPK